MSTAERRIEGLQIELAAMDHARRKDNEYLIAERDAARRALEEARADLTRACAHYDDWYVNGHSGDAGNIAYDLVSAIRQALARLSPPNQPEKDES